MTHYHPISYEIEGYLRQAEKLKRARHGWQTAAARVARSGPKDRRSLFERFHNNLASAVKKTISDEDTDLGGQSALISSRPILQCCRYASCCTAACTCI